MQQVLGWIKKENPLDFDFDNSFWCANIRGRVDSKQPAGRVVIALTRTGARLAGMVRSCASPTTRAFM